MTPLFDKAARERGNATRAAAREKSAQELVQNASLDVGPDSEAMIAKRLEEMPISYRMTYLRAMRGKTITTAVKAFCCECMGWERREISDCTALACALYSYRPFTET